MVKRNPANDPAPSAIGPGDPPSCTQLNAKGAAPVVLVCDHASNAIPAALGTLGLDPAMLARHVAYDIGAWEMTEHLAAALDAPAVLAGYSRLMIDCNRPLDDPTSIREISDGIVVPGNRGLDAAARTARAESFYWPYHRAIEEALDRIRENGAAPNMVSIHSCTPVMREFERPWHIGVLSNRDRRIADNLIEALSSDAELTIGDNQPYSGLDPYGYTIESHALPAGLANVLLEVRQDLIDTHHGAEEWAGRLAAALAPILRDPALARPFAAA